jgi:hypothetical protein
VFTALGAGEPVFQTAAQLGRPMLPVLSGYMGHAILKSTERYLRLVPGRFVKSRSTLQAPPDRFTHVRSNNNDTTRPIQSGPEAGLQDPPNNQQLLLFYIPSQRLS